MSTIRLKIDIKAGTIDIEADNESFGRVSEQAAFLLDKFSDVGAATVADEVPGEAPSNSDDTTTRPSADSAAESASNSKKKKKGAARVANWSLVENLLTDDQGASLRATYKAKAPKSQNEQVAVLVVTMKRLLKRDGFDGNEVYSAFRAVDEKVPGNLAAVFGNMTAANLGAQRDKKFVPNWKAEEMVDRDLPHKAKDNP